MGIPLLADIKGVQSIWVQTSFIALHCWLEAPESVAYLRNEHRHKFYAIAYLLVSTGNRQAEFHTVQQDMDAVIHEAFFMAKGRGVYSEGLTHRNLGLPTIAMSCEDMAKVIFEELVSQFGYPVIQVAVSEDGEHAGIFSVEPKIYQ